MKHNDNETSCHLDWVSYQKFPYSVILIWPTFVYIYSIFFSFKHNHPYSILYDFFSQVSFYIYITPFPFICTLYCFLQGLYLKDTHVTRLSICHTLTLMPALSIFSDNNFFALVLLSIGSVLVRCFQTK